MLNVQYMFLPTSSAEGYEAKDMGWNSFFVVDSYIVKIYWQQW